MEEVVQKPAESLIDRAPSEITKENAITLWMSYQASDSDRPKVGGGIIKKPARGKNTPWSGAFFIQGLYLVHSNESADNLFVGTVGVGGQKYDVKELRARLNGCEHRLDSRHLSVRESTANQAMFHACVYEACHHAFGGMSAVIT